MKNNKLLWIVSCIPLTLSVIAYRFLPEKLPMHYDLAGNIDRWGSKYEIFLFPVIILALSFMWKCMIDYYIKKVSASGNEKLQVESQSNVKILRLTALMMALCFGIMHIVITASAYVEALNNATESALDINIVTNLICGVIFVIIGNYLPKTKRNSIAGFRTKKTLSSDTLWRKSSRFGGISLMIAGVLIVVETVSIGGMLSTILMIAILLITTLIDIIYVAKLKIT